MLSPPPGLYLSVGDGALHLSRPQARHGARLPFDFLLRSLATDCGTRAIAVILSGTGTDGGLGLRAIKEQGGFVVAQDPDEAGQAGMPQNAIMTGAVDLVLPADKIPGKLIEYCQRIAGVRPSASPPENAQDSLSKIIDFLRAETPYDFRQYKRGTLQRRVEQRMALAAAKSHDMDHLRVAPGQATNDVLAMAREGMRTKLKSAIQQAIQENARVVAAGGGVAHDGTAVSFNIDVQPIPGEDGELLLVCFVEAPKDRQSAPEIVAPRDAPRVTELEHDIEATRRELQGAIRDLQIATEEHHTAHDEALSIDEEFQSTNEELLTSKEELQSLNKELTALNGQFQETLEQQRTTSNDLQNILYSTNVATLFLDINLDIRYFTPAIRSLFSTDSRRYRAAAGRLHLTGSGWRAAGRGPHGAADPRAG